MALADFLKAERLVKLPWYQKALALLGIVVLIVAIYFVFIDAGYRTQIADLKNQVVQLDKQITDLKAIERDLAKFEKQNALLKKELEKAMTKLPNDPKVEELIKDVSMKAKKYGVEVVSFNFKPEQVQPLYIEVPVDVKLRADYFPLMIFLSDISRLERIVNVSDLQLKTSREGRLEVSCSLLAYRFKEKGEEPAKKKRRGRRR